MNIEALIQLKRVLNESINNEVKDNERIVKFDMSTFFEKYGCGTAACAAGCAALDPWFIKQGFNLENKYPSYTRCDGKVLEAYAACKEFFDINLYEVFRLFSPGYYHNINDITQVQVIERIDKLLARPREQ